MKNKLDINVLLSTEKHFDKNGRYAKSSLATFWNPVNQGQSKWKKGDKEQIIQCFQYADSPLLLNGYSCENNTEDFEGGAGEIIYQDTPDRKRLYVGNESEIGNAIGEAICHNARVKTEKINRLSRKLGIDDQIVQNIQIQNLEDLSYEIICRGRYNYAGTSSHVMVYNNFDTEILKKAAQETLDERLEKFRR